jgi:putative tryptophan/tyrosine transport system substrate-binding protein
MNRREFVAGAVASMLPSALHAQQGERLRRVDILLAELTEDDPYYEGRLSALTEGLRGLGWNDGQNLKLVIHRVTPKPADVRKHVTELLAASPDLIISGGSTTTAPLLQATTTIPIVFTSAVDPVGAGFVDSLAHPGGNATGFMQFDYSLSGKWLELLKQLAPGVVRAGVIRDAATPSGIAQFAVIQSVAGSLGVDIVPVNVRDEGEIERGIAKLAHYPNAGLITATGASVIGHRDFILKLAAQHRLPAIYPNKTYVDHGGLVSYGPDQILSARLAAGYVDRILKGAKPADLPVQVPTRYELVVNLKTAKALGLELPASVVARADAVIE